jgi:hypothetical protein
MWIVTQESASAIVTPPRFGTKVRAVVRQGQSGLALSEIVWVKVEATAVEEDGDSVVVAVGEASSGGLDPLDFGVEALGEWQAPVF